MQQQMLLQAEPLLLACGQAIKASLWLKTQGRASVSSWRC